MRSLRQILETLESRPAHPAHALFAALFVGLGRTAEEIFFGYRGLSLNVASHYAAFYLAIFCGFTGIAALVLREEWERTARPVLFGILVGLLPPLIDVIAMGPGRFQYSYLDRFTPSLHGAGNPYSEAIAAWSALAVFAFYLVFKGRSLWRAVLGAALAYAYVLLTVSLTPDALKSLLAPIKAGTARTFFYLFLAYALYVGFHFRRFWPSLKRINHSLPWVLLVFLGAALSGGIEKKTVLLAVIVLFVHQGIVFANDHYDRASDEINRRAGRIESNDAWMIQALIVWMAFHVCLMDTRPGFLLLLYLLGTTAYHHPLFRWKDVFPLAYVVEGFVAALALLIGLSSAGPASLETTHLLYAALAFAGFMIASPFKDYKDVAGDRQSSTKTLYVLLHDRGWSLAKTHAWVSAVLLAFMVFPLVLLFLKGVPGLLLPALFATFVVPVFFCLRSADRKAAVERTAWLLTGYLTALVAALLFAVPSTTSGILKDYAQIESGAADYQAAHPSTAEEIRKLVLEANAARKPIRVRGRGHSMNGSSLPRTGETTIFTDRLRQYRFEEPGTITVDAGVEMKELNAFLSGRGFSLPVRPDGIGGPSVGGYIAAGGIGGGSRLHGGFWENVLEITLVTGAGEILKLKPGDDLFPWMFGSMGQLGIFVTAKLKILDAEGRNYPAGAKGMVPELEAETGRRLVWFTVFVPKAELENAKEALQAMKAAHPDLLEYRPNYVYPMTFRRFNPKLIFPRNEDFVGVGIWGYPKSVDPAGIFALEKEIGNLVQARSDVPYRRYLQAEIVPPGTDYRAYFGDAIYGEFLAIKQKLDPQGLLNCGTMFPCR